MSEPQCRKSSACSPFLKVIIDISPSKKESPLKVSAGFAEREGFEPSVPLPVQRFSRPSRSTTPASFLVLQCKSRHLFLFHAHFSELFSPLPKNISIFSQNHLARPYCIGHNHPTPLFNSAIIISHLHNNNVSQPQMRCKLMLVL